MQQIVLNYLMIVVIPLLLGALIRFLFRRQSKAWLVTAIAAILAFAAVIAAGTLPNHGSEFYGLLAVQAVCLLIGSLLMGAATKIMGRKK